MSDPTTPPLSPEFLAAYNGNVLMGTSIAFIPILVFAVCLRFYSQSLTKSTWGADDPLVLVSLFCQIGSSVMTICAIKYTGKGYHEAALQQTHPNLVTRHSKWLLAVSSFYFFSVGIPKLAVLVYYLRIFTINTYRYLVYILMAIIIATGIVCPIISLTLCRPFKFNWDRTLPGGSCYNEAAFYAWGSLPNILTDIAILIIPLPVIWKLQTSKNMKIGLILTFLTASIGLVTSIIRFDAFLTETSIFTDGTYNINLQIWTMVEPNVYLIAACLFTYRPLLNEFRRLTGRVKRSTLSPNNKSSGLAHPSHLLSSREASNKKSLSGFRRLSEYDVGSLGNTFDMNNIADVGDVESDRTGDEIQLVNLNNKNFTSLMGTAEAATPPDLGPNQIQVRSDFYVRSE